MFFAQPCSGQTVQVIETGLMTRLSFMCILTLFIVKLELASRAQSVEGAQIAFFNYLNNCSIS